MTRFTSLRGRLDQFAQFGLIDLLCRNRLATCKFQFTCLGQYIGVQQIELVVVILFCLFVESSGHMLRSCHQQGTDSLRGRRQCPYCAGLAEQAQRARQGRTQDARDGLPAIAHPLPVVRALGHDKVVLGLMQARFGLQQVVSGLGKLFS